MGLFYTINYPRDYFEKSVKPHLKQSEDLLKMLNGKVVIDTFSNISKRDYSSKDDDLIKSKEEQLSLDLKKVYDIACELSQ